MMNRNTKKHNAKRGHQKVSFLKRYTRLVLWFFSVKDCTQYNRLMDRVAQLLSVNGRKFTTEYLKESVRLINHWLAGQPTECPQNEGGPRVASRRGLPLIIPGPLRLKIEAQDRVAIRVTLTLMNYFRIIKYKGTLKLSTITDPFKGLTEELAPWEVGFVWPWFQGYLPTEKLSDFQVSRPLILRTAGPNFRTSILGAPLDAMAWKVMASEESWKAFKILSDYSRSTIYDFLKLEIGTVSGFFPNWFGRTYGEPGLQAWRKEFFAPKVLSLGRLSKKEEAAGKIRVFAIADNWTQSVLKPYHEFIFCLLRNIPQDGTFNQAGPLNKLLEKLNSRSNKWVASYDLSAATDRLPIKLQVQVMSQLFSREVAEAWRVLLVDRDWWLGAQAYRYSVGQPMGALSSWAMLALTHHFVVQMAARRVGKTTWFEDYALLGDDIVIADEAVAKSYHSLMTIELGVEINLSKSILSEKGVVEFAKRLADPQGEYTPLGPKSIQGVLRNPAYLPQLFLDYLGKGGVLDWNEVSLSLQALLKMPDLVRVSKGAMEALTWTVLQPFGFVPYPGLASSEIASSLGDEELDPYVLLESMNLAAQLTYDRDADKAMEKTTETIDRLRKVINSWERQFKTAPPSFQWLLADCERSRLRLANEIADPEWTYFDPDGLTPAQILMRILELNPSPSPIDNPLVKPKIVRPRIKRVSLDFFKLVKRYSESLMMM